MSIEHSDLPVVNNTPRLHRVYHGAVGVPTAAAEDSRLSFRARGVLLYLLAKPDTWQFRADAIARDGTEGREAVRVALRELAAYGYYRTVRVRDERGRFYTVTEVSAAPRADWLYTPAESPEPKIPLTGDGFSGAGRPGAGQRSPKVLEVQEHSLEKTSQEKTSNDSVVAAEAAVEEPSVEQRADRLTRTWWESYDPRPTQPFIAARRIVGRLLRAGWSDEQVLRACGQVGSTLVIARVEGVLRGQRPAGRPPPANLHVQPETAQDRARRELF